jgi:hypothetical protein
MVSSSFGRNRLSKSLIALLIVLAGVLGASRDAQATLRWKTDGSLCMPTRDYHDSDINWDASILGFVLRGSASKGARQLVCPIFTGPGLTQLSDGAWDTISQVTFDLKNAGASTIVYTDLVAHDYDSNSYCTCDVKSFAQATGFFQRNLFWDAISNNCGSCIGGDVVNDQWALAASVSAATFVRVNRIRVFDDNIVIIL